MNSKQTNKRILVVSGGGARGAWGAGFAKRLTEKHGEYNIAFGTSTGSLMNPLILLNRFDDLQKAYTSVTPEKIFDKNPFQKNGDLKWTVLLRVLFGRKTLGESNNLKRLIDSFITDADYKKIRDEKKVFGVAVVDFKDGEKHIKLSDDITDSRTMKDWIWASSNQPLFMTYFEPKEGGCFVDGGVRETVPVADALEYANTRSEIKDIDVIINQPKRPIIDREFKATKIFKGLQRLIEIWRTEVVDNDVLLALQNASLNDCSDEDKINIHLHYFPPELYSKNQNDLVFDTGRMTVLWNEGYKGNIDSMELLERPTLITVCKRKVQDCFWQKKQYIKLNKEKIHPVK